MVKLFYQDAHITTFEAKVTSCVQQTDGRYRIVLDQTAFFPEEGGQGADAGTITVWEMTTQHAQETPQVMGTAACSVFEVLDVQIKDDIIFHVLEAPLTPGTCVVGQVDWAQRFDYMQQHSGEHILSGLVHARYGYDNVGFHLGKEEVTLDFNGSLSLSQLRELELMANRIIWKDLPVKVSFPTSEVLADLAYRSKLELKKDVRIVEIPDVDVCACCAPHVDTTGQIGLLKVTGLQSHRGGVRINILCGERAFVSFTAHQDSVTGISQQLSVKQEKVTEGVQHLKEENLKQRERINQLQAQLLQAQTALLPSPQEQSHVVLFTGELDNIALRNTVNSLCEKYTGYCCLFSGDDERGYRFIIGSATLDCRVAASLLREQLQAKGGGTAPMVQGSTTAKQDRIRTVLAQFN